MDGHGPAIGVKQVWVPLVADSDFRSLNLSQALLPRHPLIGLSIGLFSGRTFEYLLHDLSFALRIVGGVLIRFMLVRYKSHRNPTNEAEKCGGPQ